MAIHNLIKKQSAHPHIQKMNKGKCNLMFSVSDQMTKHSKVLKSSIGFFYFVVQICQFKDLFYIRVLFNFLYL